MPYLWYNPFGCPNSKGDSLIKTLLCCLPQNEKRILDDIRLLKDSFKNKSPLFNYPKFIICFNSENFINFVKQLFHSNITLILHLIGNMIFHRFNRLKILELHFNNQHNNQNDYKLIEDINSSIKFQESLTRLTRFEIQIYINEYTNFIINLLNKISRSCNNIHHLSLIIYKGKYNFYQSLDNSISSLIKSQAELKSLVMNEYCLSYENTSIYDAILSTHSNSLKYLGFCVMNNYSLLMKIISTCKNLETLEITQQGNNEKSFILDESITHQEISIKYFYYRNIIGNENFIKTILKMSSKNLKSFSSRYISEEIIDTIELYCPNISCLNISMNSNYVLNLIHLISGLEFLEYFTLELENGWPKYRDERLQLFANILPKSLTYLGLNFYITPHQLDFFLKECAKIQLHTLELMYFNRNNLDHLKVVVDYSKEFNHLKQVKFMERRSFGLGETSETNEITNVDQDLKVETDNLTICEVKPFNFSHYDRKHLVDRYHMRM
ncbi:hypothetical protein RclHR1_06490012 [Rhizophagus clarus]|uniref:F-box domain-containing protein n=1 Tax=Rhizophagus clarus TaxID=94130 RepID=A0A2Z6SIP1_9GLOM|nr:hypothetical protein RclHR1_06490012 [Rhizophagus clarus]GES96732.1 hypothetical protein GLOIN_2v1780543 [Rhizophagus clarus]